MARTTAAPRVRDRTKPTRRKFSVDEYYRMAEAGILGPDERVELLKGDIYTMAPIGSRHAACVDFLGSWFNSHVADRAHVRVQGPVRLESGSEPEPDIAVLRLRSDGYRQSHPTAGDILLLIEIADTSLAHDRDLKIGLYARAGIPEVWLVDLTRNRVAIHRGPSGSAYSELAVVGRESMLTPAAFEDLQLPVRELLPA